MRVAIITSSYWPIVGGRMIYARDLARELVRQGHKVTVATRFTSGLRRTTWDSLSGVDPTAVLSRERCGRRHVTANGPSATYSTDVIADGQAVSVCCPMSFPRGSVVQGTMGGCGAGAKQTPVL